MIRLLAARNLTLKPWRSVFLLFGFSMGVAVMIVLLSIGEALLDQSRDERLVGGGDVTVLPEGVDVEVLKTGGLGGLFFSIDHARFIYRQLLAAPRLSKHVKAILTFGAAGAGAHSAEAQKQIRQHCKALATPMLLTSSEKDPFDGANHIREWGKGLKHVGSRIVPGTDHGMAIYYDVRKEVLAFVKKTIAPSVRARPVRSR